MKFNNLVAASTAAMAFSANAALFVTSSTPTDASLGRTTGSVTVPVMVFVFSPAANVTLTTVGLFDQNGDGFNPAAGGMTLQVWQNTTGLQGTSLGSFSFSGTAQDSAGAANEWRTQAANISLSAGTTYAFSVVSSVNPVASYFYGHSEPYNANDYGDSSVAGVTANFLGGVFASTPVIATRGAVSAADIFDVSNSVDSSTRRIVTGEFTAVPEPSTYALVAGAGLAGFGLWRRRSTKA